MKSYKPQHALELKAFAEMDYYAVEKYDLSIELMMENAGLHLAKLCSQLCGPDSTIVVGVGNGNNGGGGLVAARRLVGWGYKVFLDLPVEITKELPLRQLERAIKFGVNQVPMLQPDIWIDAYLGFSQRLPLSVSIIESIERANKSGALLISLDLPTGISEGEVSPYFMAEHLLTLAAYKQILNSLPDRTNIYLADLGIPREVYEKFGVEQPPFYSGGILQIDR